MKRVVWGLFVILALSSCTLLSSQSASVTPIIGGDAPVGSSPIQTPTSLPWATQSTPTEAPTESPTNPPADEGFGGAYMLSLEIPNTIQAGREFEATILLVGTGEIAEFYFEAIFDVAYFFVRDADPNQPADQIIPLSLDEDSVVEVNEVNRIGFLRYKVNNLGGTDQMQREVARIQLQAVSSSSGVIEIKFGGIALKGPDGTELPVSVSPALVSIVEGPVPTADTPAPTELPTALPTATAPPVPTEAATGTAVVPTSTLSPTPTAEPTPVPSPTPFPTPTAIPPTPLPTAVPRTVQDGIAEGIYYRIQSGQTLYQVAQTFGSTPDAIAAASGIPDVTAISVGTLLRVPVTPPVGRAAYFVAPRETLYSIARAFGFTTEELAAQNGIAPPYNVQAGQWVVLRP